mgnify:CR=1 FL=1
MTTALVPPGELARYVGGAPLTPTLAAVVSRLSPARP